MTAPGASRSPLGGLTRRHVLAGLAGALAGATGLAGYAFGIEPRFRLETTVYAPRLPLWPADFPLSIAFLSDIHAGEPHMSLERIAEIVERTNALGADIILLGGDYVAAHKFLIRSYGAAEWARELSALRAPLGVHSVLGNHDWWHGPTPKAKPDNARGVTNALKDVGITVLENKSLRFVWKGRPFWVAGLGDQLSFKLGFRKYQGVDDLPGTLRQVTDNAPVILLAHEPDIFANLPTPRAALTLSGHTHGGQVRLFGWSPVVPSEYENRFAYGHVEEGGRHLIVSGGLGTSILPIRFGVPPEIVLIRLGQTDAAA